MEIGKIKLFCGDCLEIMGGIADGSIDAVICDLPYGVLNKNNPDAEWDKTLPLEALWSQYERIVNEDGVIVLFGQGMFTAKLMMSNPRMWRYNLIWDKGRCSDFLNANRRPLRSHEDICVFYRRLPVYHPQFTEGKVNHSRGGANNACGGNSRNRCYGKFRKTPVVITTKKYPLSVLRFPKERNYFHPTQKPVSLLEWLIRTYTDEGMTVLDNTMGSGSTMVACVNTKRRGIGIEKDTNYFDISKRRVEEAHRTMSEKLFVE